jgi:glutathione S-transferase
VFRRRTAHPVDEADAARARAAAPKVLPALEPLVDEELPLADLHLGAMMAYFVLAPEGATLLRDYPNLTRWWKRISARPSFAATDPGLPSPEGDRR